MEWSHSDDYNIEKVTEAVRRKYRCPADGRQRTQQKISNIILVIINTYFSA